MVHHAFVLVGPREGFSGSIGPYTFDRGVHEYHDSQDKPLEGLITYMARVHNAHERGSKALEAAELEWANNPGNPRHGKTAAAAVPAKILTQDDVVNAGGVNAVADVRVALHGLDPSNDEHWTGQGIPSVDAVSTIVGRKVSREEIERSAPGLNRTAAQAAAGALG
jgi:hypothetical protein